MERVTPRQAFWDYQHAKLAREKPRGFDEAVKFYLDMSQFDTEKFQNAFADIQDIAEGKEQPEILTDSVEEFHRWTRNDFILLFKTVENGGSVPMLQVDVYASGRKSRHIFDNYQHARAKLRNKCNLR